MKKLLQYLLFPFYYILVSRERLAYLENRIAAYKLSNQELKKQAKDLEERIKSLNEML